MSPEVKGDTVLLRLEGALATVLERMDAVRTASGRRVLVALLEDSFGRAIPLQAGSAEAGLSEVVSFCVRTSDGPQVLVYCLTLLDPRAAELSEVRELVDEVTAFRALPVEGWDGLRALLSGISLGEPTTERRQLLALASASTGGKADDLPPECRSVWGVFLHLADRNAVPGGLPPALAFLLGLADHLGDQEASAEVTRWGRQWAKSVGMSHLLPQTVPAVHDVPGDVLHLVFELDPDPVDEDKVVLSHWRQWGSGRWPAQRDGGTTVRLDDIEAEIEHVIGQAETELGHMPNAAEVSSIALEFILPWEMLNTPVEFWRKNAMSDYPVPLAVDHPVVLRSLERMRSTRFLLRWKQRWAALVQGAASRDPYWTGEESDLTSVAVELNKQDIVSVVLSEPPGDRRGRGWHEAALAFRAGIPVIIWDREDCSTPTFREAVATIFGGGELVDLPQRVARLRREALMSTTPDASHAGRSLAVLWDDADRMPDVLVPSWNAKGGPA